MKILTLVLLLTAVGAHAQISGQAKTGSPQISATLAPLNSFEFEMAPTYTKLDVLLKKTTLQLRAGDITKAHAGAVLKAAQKVHALLKSALAECGEDSSGLCAKDPAGAYLLLDHAKTSLAAIK